MIIQKKIDLSTMWLFAKKNLADTPMSTVCRNIEIDIKEMLVETDLPSKIEPYNGV